MRGVLGQCLEMMWCLVRQFNFVSVVHKEEFFLMRASFYFTHHIDSGEALLPELSHAQPAPMECILVSAMTDMPPWQALAKGVCRVFSSQSMRPGLYGISHDWQGSMWRFE